MFIRKKNGAVICTGCNVGVKTIEQYEFDLNSGNPDWFYEPYDEDERYMYICPKCKKRDFISESEVDCQ